MNWSVIHGDALAVLRTMETHSVDAIVTDPPAGIAFMNAEWDKDKGGRDAWIAWLRDIFIEARRVAKPGAHALVWSLPRTSHWTAVGLEDAGWSMRDRKTHLFGTGFPKNHSVPDALAAKDLSRWLSEHPIEAEWHRAASAWLDGEEDEAQRAPEYAQIVLNEISRAANTGVPDQWEGWGTALKPSVEDWWLAQAPLSEDTIAGNVAVHGTGALHIDACRIGRTDEDTSGWAQSGSKASDNVAMSGANFAREAKPDNHIGRWPAHLVLSHNVDCVPIGIAKIKAAPPWNDNRPPSSFTGAKTSAVHHSNDDGTETIESWECSAGCAVAMLDAQSGIRQTHGGTIQTNHAAIGYGGGGGSSRAIESSAGGASRFFFCAKPSTAERELGLDGFASATVDDGREITNDTAYQRGATRRRNIHPTVKSVALMRWLVRLITPPGGLVLDLFAGSGTTGIATLCEGFRFVGVEQEAEFHRIACARIAFAAANPRAFDPETVKASKADPRQADLFGRTGT